MRVQDPFTGCPKLSRHISCPTVISTEFHNNYSHFLFEHCEYGSGFTKCLLEVLLKQGLLEEPCLSNTSSIVTPCSYLKPPFNAMS